MPVSEWGCKGEKRGALSPLTEPGSSLSPWYILQMSSATLPKALWPGFNLHTRTGVPLAPHLQNQQHCSSFLEEGKSLLGAQQLELLSHRAGCPVMGTWHSSGELKIDLGHPFATGARIARRLPWGRRP